MPQYSAPPSMSINPDSEISAIINTSSGQIQGGDPTGTGMGGPGYTFPDEPVSRDYLRGTMAMANAGPNTNGSQFFIMHKNGGLPKNYTIFGEVVEGIDVVDTIANLEVSMSGSGEMSKPVNPTKILDIAIEEI